MDSAATIGRRVGRARDTFAWVLDVVMAVGVGAVSIAGSLGAQGRLVPPLEPLDPLGWALVLVACGALALRRWPTVVFGVVALAVVGYLAGRYPYGPIFLVLSFTMYRVTVRAGTARAGLLCLVTYVATVGTIFAVEAPMPVDDVVAYLGGWACTLVVPWLVGVIVRLRRRRDADEAAQRAYEERLAMARDVHDVVAHGLIRSGLGRRWPRSGRSAGRRWESCGRHSPWCVKGPLGSRTSMIS